MAGCFVSQVVVLLLATWRSAAMPCNSSQILAPTKVEDTEGAYQLAKAVNCSGGSFDVEWIGSVSVETTIIVLNGTTLSVTGASNGSSVLDGSNETSLFEVIDGNLHLSKLTMMNGTAEYGGAIMATDSVVTTSNCTFFNNAAHYGGAVCLFDSTFEAMKTTFVGNIASTDGGAILTRDSDLTVGQGGSFEDNDAWYGGAVCSEHSAIHVSVSTSFLGNTAYVGGGIFLWASDFTADNATFSGNNATGYGGAISAGNSSLTIANGAHFLNNSATGQGGAVDMYVNCSLLLSDVVEFDGNTAEFGGGLFLESSVLDMDGYASFAGNVAINSGGGIYPSFSDITITGTALWEENDAFYGAGIRLYYFSLLDASGDVTSRNNTAIQGGGMWVSLHSDVVIHGSSTFESNSAYHGGGMVIYNATAQFSEGSTSNFYNNSCLQAGGAILLFNAGEVTVAGNAMFSNNRAYNGAGVAASEESYVAVYGDVTFINNSAELGAGIAGMEGSYVTVDGGVTFANNTADIGAGIAALEASYVTLNGDVVLADNFASSAGGAIYLDAPYRAQINGTRFFGNKAMKSGGAIVSFSAGSGDEYSNIKQCVFEHNKAGDAGGALFIGGGFVLINESRFNFNSAERAGGAVMASGIVHFDKSILADNTARVGPAVYSAVRVVMESTDACDNQLLCDDGSFLDWNSGSAYDIACDSCPVEGNNCTKPYYDRVQLCEPVFEHTTSSALDGTLETLKLEPGYWRSSDTSRDIRECYEAAACVGGVQGLCASGYQGPFCAVCADGHTRGLGFTCTECSEERRNTTKAVGLIVVVAAVAMVVVSLSCLRSSATSSTTGLHTCSERFRRAVSRLRCASMAQTLKIVIVSWQIVTQFATVASVTYPAVYEAFLRCVDVFNLNLSWILSAGCLIESNFYHSLLVSTLGPFAIAGCVLASHAISCRRCPAHDQEARDKINGRHASVLFWISVLIYATVSSFVFRTFACDDLDDGSSFLRYDHSLECYTTTHNVFMVYACVMVAVFPLGIPLCYTFVLYRNRACRKLGVGSEARANDVASFKELWEPYRPKVYFYEVVECLRRVLLSGVVVFIFPNTAGQVATSLLLAMFTAGVFLALDPYVSRWHTWLARASHAVVILSLYVALLKNVGYMDDDMLSQHVFAYVLVATSCGLILAVVVEAYRMVSTACF